MRTPATEGPRPSRWQRPFTVFQTNLQEIDAALDVEAALDVIEDHGADTWVLNAGGISAFYPTDLAFQARSPFLDRRPSQDLLGDAVAAAARRGIRVIARLDFSKVTASVAAGHPDWLFVSAEGEPQVYHGLHSTCPSSAYYQERAFDIFDEILDRYDVGGFFVNWFNFNERDYSEVVHGACHCNACVEKFAEFGGGTQLPTGRQSPGFLMWRRFTEATLRELGSAYTSHISRAGRDLATILTRGGNVVYQEANNAFRHLPGNEFWPHATAEAVSAHVTARPGVPLMVNAAAHIESTYRMGAEQPEQVAQYLAQAIARGGNPSTYILGEPGRLPMRHIDLAGQVTAFRREWRDMYAALRPAASIALVRPDLGPGGYDAYLAAIEEYRGVYLALQQGHRPFDVVPLGAVPGLSAEDALSRYRLAVLPDVGALDPATARALDAFVERGGNILMTGGSGTAADGTVTLAAAPAQRRIGARLAGNELWSTYATLDDQPGIEESRFTGSIVPIYGSDARYEWKPGTAEAGVILGQAPWGPPELCYGHTASGAPAVASIRYGGGTASMITWTIGRTYREFGKTEVRDHLLRVADPLAEVPVSAELPDQVELIVGCAGTDLIIHLINRTGQQRRSFGPHVPVGGRLLIHRATGHESVVALGSGRTLLAHREGEILFVDIPPIGLVEVVRIRRPE